MLDKLNLDRIDLKNPYIPEISSGKKELIVSKEKKKDKKGFKSYWDSVFDKRKLAKHDKVAVIFLKNNRTAVPMEIKPKNGFFEISGKTYHQDRDCVYTMSKDRLPLAIIPEWSLVPIGTKEWQDKEVVEKLANLQAHVLDAIRHAEAVRIEGQEGKKINPKVLIVCMIIGVVAFAIFRNAA